MFESLDFRPGVVKWNSYNLSPEDMTDIKWLDEDMFMVEYPEGYLIDVGWYGRSLTLNGVFYYIYYQEHRMEQPSIQRRISVSNRIV